MSDGPLPKSTCGVDSSPEAIAGIVDRLYLDRESGRPHWRDCYRAAIMLAQVARERDEAITKLETFKQNLRLRGDLDPAVAAERQLARRMHDAGLAEAAEIARLFCEEQEARRDDALTIGNTTTGLLRARCAQTASDIAEAILAASPPHLKEP